MAKMWAGRTNGNTNALCDDFNSSIHFDCRMYKQDIQGSIAHAKMLSKCGIISAEDESAIINGLCDILNELENGNLQFDFSCEDIHMFIEQELTSRIGDAGKRLHTARSRNDQVALDIRLYLRQECAEIISLLKELIFVIVEKAEQNKDAILPGYTHLQRAQPIVFAQQLLAYANMLLRDINRIHDTCHRMNYSPIGACALAGTTYSTDRYFEAQELGFDGICENSIDAVSDRDFCIELAGDIAIIMMHLSRFSEEIILWNSWEFKFTELSDEYTTGSSIMPQKKNSDMAELVRGKTGRAYGNLTTLLTLLKGLPLAYNKDMQEDKEAIFDSVDTVKKCLEIFCGMLKGMTINKENMLNAAKSGFINATDLADYLTIKGVPFRTAYKISGEIVAYCIENGFVLENLPMEIYKNKCELFDTDVYNAVDLSQCVARRNSTGGTSPASVEKQIENIKIKLQAIK